jgi:hypothetical protein
MINQILRQNLHHLKLLLIRQPRNRRLNNTPHSRMVRRDKTAVVEKRNTPHDELAIKPIRRAPVTGDAVAKVLDLEGALEAGGEEAAEGRDERGEGGEDDHVELHGEDVDGVGEDGEEGGEAFGDEGDGVGARCEDGVGHALEAREDGGAQVVDGADEEFVLCEEVRCDYAPDDGEEPGAQEAFPGFLGRDLDQLVPAEGDAAEVGEDVVGYDHGDGEDEPDEAFEDVVDDEVGLADDEEERHVGPGELGELELVVALLQREDEEDEAWKKLVWVKVVGFLDSPMMYSMKEMKRWWVAKGSRMRSTSRMCLK